MFSSSLFLMVIAGYLVFVIFVITTLLMIFFRSEKRCRNLFSEAVIIFAEILFTIIGPIIGFIRFDEFGPDIPFAKEHVLVVILLVISSSAFYWIARFTNRVTNPLVRIMVSVGLLQGIVLCFFTSIHFIAYFPMGLIYPTLGFELLSPLVALLLLSREFYFYNKTEFNYDEHLPYRKELGFVPIPLKIMQFSFFTRLLIFGTLMIPMVIIQVAFAYGLGQDIDALIKAFTHSHGFIFSM